MAVKRRTIWLADGVWEAIKVLAEQRAMTPSAYIGSLIVHQPNPTTIEDVLDAPRDFGSQVAMRGGLPKDVADRIDAIEAR